MLVAIRLLAAIHTCAPARRPRSVQLVAAVVYFVHPRATPASRWGGYWALTSE